MDDATKTDIVETVQELVTALRNARRPNVPYPTRKRSNGASA
jgi:hypothetical protein